MARKIRTHLGAGDDSGVPLQSLVLTKAEFAKRLSNLMLERGWTQAELGRRSGLTRASVSSYITCRSLPSPIQAKMLADTLGVELSQLLPNIDAAAMMADAPMFSFTVSPNDPTRGTLYVRQIIKRTTSTKIQALLDEDGMANVVPIRAPE